MSYPIPSFEAIRNTYLMTLQNLNPDFDISVDSDNYVRATANASVVEGLYMFINWVFLQIFPDTADEENLVRHTAVKNLRLKEAKRATGTAKVYGEMGAVLPAGAQIRLSNGVMVELVGASAVLDVTPKIVPVRAVTAGVLGNVAGLNGVLTVSASGLTGEVTDVTLTGGVDVENYEALLARLLDVLRNPPAGGKPSDLKRWAESIAGVSKAYVYQRLRGLGTTDVFISSPNGLPTAALLNEVRAYLVSMSPSGYKDIATRAPAPVVVDVAFRVAGRDDFQTVIKPQIDTLVRAFFATLEPGEKLVRSKLESLVTSLPNISDCVLDAPLVNALADVSGTTLGWVRLGDLTIDPLV